MQPNGYNKQYGTDDNQNHQRNAKVYNSFEIMPIHKFINGLLSDLYRLGAKNVILTGVYDDPETVGAISYDGISRVSIMKELQEKSYHGTGDIFSSVIVADIMNGKSLHDTLDHATDFVIESIIKTMRDDDHLYGVKFEDVLKDELR